MIVAWYSYVSTEGFWRLFSNRYFSLFLHHTNIMNGRPNSSNARLIVTKLACSYRLKRKLHAAFQIEKNCTQPLNQILTVLRELALNRVEPLCDDSLLTRQRTWNWTSHLWGSWKRDARTKRIAAENGPPSQNWKIFSSPFSLSLWEQRVKPRALDIVIATNHW